jgi:hypothetical protein
VIGDLEGSSVTLNVAGRSHPGCTDYWDGNWIAVDVEIRVRSFTGKYGADFRSEELNRFLEGLRALLENQGNAVFETMEEQLTLTLARDTSGQINVTGEAIDQPGTGNRLTFELQVDQTYLLPIIRQVENVLASFPVIGKPD